MRTACTPVDSAIYGVGNQAFALDFDSFFCTALSIFSASSTARSWSTRMRPLCSSTIIRFRALMSARKRIIVDEHSGRILVDQDLAVEEAEKMDKAVQKKLSKSKAKA